MFVYRLVNEGTIEDAIFKKAYSKVFLFRRIVDDQSLQWKKKDLDSLRYIGLPTEPSKRVDRQLLKGDVVLQHLYSKSLVTSLECHSNLFASDDMECLRRASQI